MHTATSPTIRNLEPARFLTCPNCAHQIDLAVEGMSWDDPIRNPIDVIRRLQARYGTLARESLVVLTLNTRNHVLRERELYRGSVSSTLVRVAEVVHEVIRDPAGSRLVLVHNHPASGPASPDDLHLTAEVQAACRLLDLELLDHVVLKADGSFVSLRNEGMLR